MKKLLVLFMLTGVLPACTFAEIIITDKGDDFAIILPKPATTADLATKVDLSAFDGGWYYPDWFAWDFSYSADGVPDSTTTVTNSDLIQSMRVFSVVSGSYDLDFYSVRSTDYSTPSVSSSDPSIATATTFCVSYVSTGTSTITASIGGFSRSTNLVFEVFGGITNREPVGLIAGTAADAFLSAIDSRLTDGTDTDVYSTQDHSATNYVRNIDSWVSGLDLTCVSPWNSTGGRLRAGTLIGSDCVIYATHYPIGTGATIRFVTTNNAVIDRTIDSQLRVDGTDFTVAKLSSEISTNDCRPALLLPAGSQLYDYMPNDGDYGEYRVGLFIDQYERAYVGSILYAGYGSTWRQGTNATHSLYWKYPVPGDSGSPMFLITSNHPPIITGTFSTSLGGPSVSYYNELIRETAATLGCNTNTITDADFDAMGFTSFSTAPPSPGS